MTVITGRFKTGVLALAITLILIITGCPNGTTDIDDEIYEETQSTEDSATYTVTYKGNQASGGTVPLDSGSYKKGETVTVSDNTGSLSLNCSSFTGWNTRANGSGTSYAAGETFTMGTEDVTLYARWDIDFASLFTPSSRTLPGVHYSSSAFADVDGDGDQDLIFTGNTGNGYTAMLYHNDGKGIFYREQELTGVLRGTSSFADVDGDGDQDLLIAGYTGSSASTVLYSNNGSGQFTESSAEIMDMAVSSSSFADVDGDGDLDLVINGNDGESIFSAVSKLYLNDGSGLFNEKTDISMTGAGQGACCFGDVDGDGDPDLVTSGMGFPPLHSTLYKNDGSGNFSAASADLKAIFDGTNNFCDIDEDGDLDLLISGNGSSTLYLNDGTGNFSETSAGLTALSLSSSSFADLDGDGDPDLVLTGMDGTDTYVSLLYINDGRGNFTHVPSGLTAVCQGSISITDVDGDGDRDLLLTGRDINLNPTTTLYLNGLY